MLKIEKCPLFTPAGLMKVQNFHNLYNLSLAGMEVVDDDILINVLEKCDSIYKLNISHCSITDEAFLRLPSRLKVPLPLLLL